MSAPQPRQSAIDWPHLAFATVVAGWIIWYCSDAWMAQAQVQNLILILPASLVAVILYLCIVVECCRPEIMAATRRVIATGLGVKIASAMALLAAYAIAAPLAGFDVASFVYVLATLWLLGERRTTILLLIPAVYCVVAVYCFDTLLDTPLPMLIMPGGAS